MLLIVEKNVKSLIIAQMVQSRILKDPYHRSTAYAVLPFLCFGFFLSFVMEMFQVSMLTSTQPLLYKSSS